ncbi:hypothetical protein [Methylobacterium sp. 77]|uniref:hypothetical protein n=1 Tax=Methylobacterium sp. 77 TaxID=1101192 RepID=UPI000363E43D|nr:hypothetical protein [Methylobacterium sp. 77]
MNLHLQPVQVATGCQDREGRLVFDEGLLLAILVRLSDMHGDDAGRWCLEIGFGPLSGLQPPPFIDLDAAQAWIADRLA